MIILLLTDRQKPLRANNNIGVRAAIFIQLPDNVYHLRQTNLRREDQSSAGTDGGNRTIASDSAAINCCYIVTIEFK